MTKFDDQRHLHELQEFDKKIAEHEAEVTRLQEGRREYVNRHNLNPPVGKAKNGQSGTDDSGEGA